MEARIGFEPMDKGFADLCLTTWLPRPVGKKNTSRRITAAARGSRPDLLLRFGFYHHLGGIRFACKLTNPAFTFGSCSKLLSHNGEACYQNPITPVNVGYHSTQPSGWKGVEPAGGGLARG
jgi:hypothetical protein